MLNLRINHTVLCDYMYSLSGTEELALDYTLYISQRYAEKEINDNGVISTKLTRIVEDEEKFKKILEDLVTDLIGTDEGAKESKVKDIYDTLKLYEFPNEINLKETTIDKDALYDEIYDMVLDSIYEWLAIYDDDEGEVDDTMNIIINDLDFYIQKGKLNRYEYKNKLFIDLCKYYLEEDVEDINCENEGREKLEIKEFLDYLMEYVDDHIDLRMPPPEYQQPVHLHSIAYYDKKDKEDFNLPF